MGTRDAMVAQAERSLGVKGRPNAITRSYAARNGSYFATAAWCNMSITEWARASGNYDAVCFGVDYAYTVYHAQKFQAKGRWYRDVAGIQRGDIVFFDWGGTDNVPAIDHVGIVTDVKGSNVYTIEGNTSNSCARRVRTAASIAGYGRPAYAAAPVPPAPAPPQEETAVPVSVYYEDLGPGGKPEANLVIQKFLAKENGLDYSSGPGVWGPKTMDSYSKFQKTLGFTGSPAQPGSDADGRPGVTSMTRFAAKYKFTLKRRTTTPPPPPPPPSGGEPAHDYTRTTYGGRRVNQRTKAMLEAAARIHGSGFSVSQGSYNPGGVAASAGTHDGGGVVDIASSSNALLKALRQVGFAAWVRTPAEGFSYHIHACAIGDREMSSGARNQVRAYFNGRNGLASNRADSAPASVGRPWPSWAAKYR
ncbi:CHAP domain-containing protein [Streptomyces microflavus]|uniref:CHAP domain-containing protein n=1 Tax=Streptomyces microflavus TaxID=1919 RepID=UPI003686DDAC